MSEEEKDSISIFDASEIRRLAQLLKEKEEYISEQEQELARQRVTILQLAKTITRYVSHE